MTKQVLRIVALAAITFLAACNGGSHSRGQFVGHVVGKTEAEILSRVGKPDEIIGAGTKTARWVYNNKTFDPDNLNQVDRKATIILELNSEGKLVGGDVLYG